MSLRRVFLVLLLGFLACTGCAGFQPDAWQGRPQTNGDGTPGDWQNYER